MDLISLVQEAAARGEISPDVVVRLLQRLIAGGQHTLVVEALREHDLLELPADSVAGLSVESPRPDQSLGGSGEQWGVGGYDPDAPEVNANVLERAIHLRETSQGTSRAPVKYEIGEEVARGGVGRIDLVRDNDLMRTLVMKTLIEGNEASEYVLHKFVEEAQITAQLEHPHIVPVHDFGFFSGGEVFFTMKLVQGRTLKDVVKALRKGDEETQREFTRTKLLNIFRQVCLAIGFANSRGVVHRDIKSSNIMVGAYGETLVLDWGIAKVIGRAETGPEPAVSTLRSESEDATMVGVVTGTPAYMSPEQAAGKVDTVDGRSDVYSLGAVLYEILTYRPPFRGKNFRQILAQVLTRPPMPLTKRAPNNNIPRVLEDIALRCLAKRPEDRFPDAGAVVEALDTYMAGVEDLDRRARLSETKLEEGLGLVEEYTRARGMVEHVRQELMEAEWQVRSHDPLEIKRGLWAKQAQVAEHRAQMHQRFSAAAQALMSAIGFNPDNEEASNELARLYWYRLRDAEREDDDDGVIYYRGLVEAYNRGLLDDQLKGEGRLIIRSAPSGADVIAGQYVEVDLQLQQLMDEALGRTPLNNIPLRQGSWLLTLRQHGHRDVRYPVRVDRGEVADVACRFFTEDQIGQHFLYVPGGPFIMGGDPACSTARHRRVVQVEDLFVARYPVTCGEYLAFIHDLQHRAPHHAQARVPRLKEAGGYLWTPDASGQITMPSLDEEGFQWDVYWPVFGITFEDAQAYCAWYTERVAYPVRLPTEEEWEKAARGTDGRLYPWGSRFDATFCKSGASRPGRSLPERVGSYPIDVSPYGTYDMAGLVAEYCDSPFGADPELRVVKGGSYRTQADVSCRVTHRMAVMTSVPSLGHGFRVVKEPPTSQAPTRRLIRPRFEE